MMSKENTEIFNEIAPEYEEVNDIFSFGIDRIWRRQAAKSAIIEKNNYSLLDIATGTGDFAFDVIAISRKYDKNIDITGIDLSEGMLAIARKRANEKNIKITFETGDAMELQYDDNTFDVVTNSMALRNFDSKEKFFAEAYRVLKKGGKLVLADTACPVRIYEKAGFYLYSRIILFEGSIINKGYSFMVNSILKSNRNQIQAICNDSGFKCISMKNLFTGIPFLLTAIKN